jgi:type I restriction enzyme M protein
LTASLGGAISIVAEKTLAMKRPWRRFSFLGCSNDLGYKDSQIKAKETLETIAVSRGGRKTEKYKPDFALTVKGAPRCIIDAKAIRESPVEWVSQCSGYCLALNQRYPAKNPVKFFVLSNGIKTLVYQWDNAEPINDLDFSDFEYGNPKY